MVSNQTRSAALRAASAVRLPATRSLRTPMERGYASKAPGQPAGSAKPAGATEFSGQSYGKKVTEDESSHANQLHAMGPGRYEYLADFYKSLNKGPVKLELGAQAPKLSAEDRRKAEEQDRAFKLMQRSMILGTVFAFVGGAIAWWVTKKILGVRDIAEFGDRMKTIAPKAGNDESELTRSLKEATEGTRDAISESESLATWRRTVRAKFNTEEGATMARQNSILMAEKRQEERKARKQRHASNESPAKDAAAEAAAEAVAAEAAVLAGQGAEPVTEAPLAAQAPKAEAAVAAAGPSQ